MKQLGVDVFINNIGKHIRELRIKQNMTQLDLATKSNIDVRQIQRLERGHTSATLKTLFKVAQGLDIEFKNLFDFPTKTEDS